jgi:hypothetical protein
MWIRTEKSFLIALICAALSIQVAPAAASARGNFASRAAVVVKSSLARSGYRQLSVRCSGSSSRRVCRWHGTRRARPCSGTATATRRPHGKQRLRWSHRSCIAPSAQKSTASTSTSTSAKRPSPPKTSTPTPPGSGTTSPTPSTHAVTFGFNTYTTSRTIAEQKSVGASTSRLFVDWANVEPTRGQWSWQQTDQSYAALVAAGLRPLIVAFTAPCWARPSTDCSNPYFTGPPDPAYDQDWANYVRQLVTRYPQAIGIEIWNEPNLDAYFLPHANPARFTQLLQEAYAAVKGTASSMPVVSGGLILAPPVSGPVPGGEGTEQFLQGMYDAGAAHYMDALGVHIYPSDYVNGSPATWDPSAMQLWLSQIQPIRVAANAGTEPIWITEMGISTATEPGWPAAVTPAVQATDLDTMVGYAQSNPAIAVAIVHSLEDQSVGYNDPDNAINAGWGAFTSDGTPKAAACVLSRDFHGSLSC